MVATSFLLMGLNLISPPAVLLEIPFVVSVEFSRGILLNILSSVVFFFFLKIYSADSLQEHLE